MSSIPAIAALSAELTSQQVAQQVAYRVAATQLEATRQQGEAMAQMIAASAATGKAVDRGQLLDLTA